MDASELGHESPGAVLDDPAAARERAGGELKYRASAGANGVAPMQRLMDERRAIGGKLAARVQRKADAGGGAGAVEIPEGGGAKLPNGVRAKMEPKLGADLSDVQVHTGGASAKAAAGIGARAFTVGSDVHFNSGEFAPGSKEGDRLLAHELTHVVQGKKSGIQRKQAPDAGGGGGGGGGGAAAHDSDAAHGAEHGGGEVSHPDEPAEKEADAVADGVTDQLHGGGKGAAGGKGKDKDKKKGGGAHALGAEAHAHDGGGHGAGGHGGGELVGHEAAHVVQQSAGVHGGGGGHGAQGGGHGAEGGGQAAAPAEKPAAISAKFVGVGRKIFRQEKGPAAPAASSKPAAPGAPGTGPSSTKATTPEETLNSPEFKEFEKRYSDLLTSLQMPADPAAAQKIWLDVVRTIQTTNPTFAAKENKLDPNDPRSRSDLTKAAIQKIITQFDPIIAQLTPLMEKFTKGKKIWAFWSGNAASSIAKANADVSLEKSSLGSLFDGINITGKWDTQMWAALSRAYATHAAKDAESKTYRGFVGKGSSAEQSIFNKIEQPQFASMLDQRVAANVKVTWYACAYDPADDEKQKPDTKCNVAGMGGVIGSGPDRAAMVAMAESVNAKREKVWNMTKKVVPPDQVDAALADAEKAAAQGAGAQAGAGGSSSSSSAPNSGGGAKPPASSSASANAGAAPPSTTPKKS